MKKDLFLSYDDSSDRKNICSAFIETITGTLPIKLTMDLIENHTKITLYNKLHSFYLNSKDIPPAEHEKVLHKLNASKNFRRSAAELLLELIDKTITDASIDLLCNLYKNTAQDNISEDDFFRLAITLQKCTYTDLLSLKNYENASDISFSGIYEGSATDSLFAAGLVYQHIIGSPILYKVNSLGADMLRYGIIG